MREHAQSTPSFLYTRVTQLLGRKKRPRPMRSLTLAYSVSLYYMAQEMKLFAGQTLSEKTINEPNMRYFWETVATSVITRESGGHVDIFVPLVETGNGCHPARDGWGC